MNLYAKLSPENRAKIDPEKSTHETQLRALVDKNYAHELTIHEAMILWEVITDYETPFNLTQIFKLFSNE